MSGEQHPGLTDAQFEAFMEVVRKSIGVALVSEPRVREIAREEVSTAIVLARAAARRGKQMKATRT